jgi:hypothetical protein
MTVDDTEQRLAAATRGTYIAFLGGPPIIGFLGNRLTELHALTVVVVVLVVSTLLASTLQPRQTSVNVVPLSSSTTGS